MKKLQVKHSNLVAVYGSLRKGLGNHRLLQDLEPVSVETLSGFDMYSMGSFPCVYHGDGDITVEVYEVSKERLLGPLDSLEGHPGFYRREPVETSQGLAWLYVMVSGQYKIPANQVHNGDWYEFRTNSKKLSGLIK